MGITTIVALLTGIALFLFGMSLMGDGLKKVAGSKMELVLYKLSSNPLKGILLGTGVTAVIQSSCATSVMVVGFVNSGMMKLRQAISVVLGTLLGTSITGWILCLSGIGGSENIWLQLLSTATLTGIIAVIGVIFNNFSKNQTRRHIGGILMGFAVLMTGMTAMSGAVSQLKDDPQFIALLTDFSNPFLGIAIGAAVTAILQSASAAVGILQALAMTGAIDFKTALPIIMGIAIGAAVPVLLSSIGAGIAARRTAFSYLLSEVIGIAVLAGIFYGVNAAVGGFAFMNTPVDMVSVAAVNSVFRLFIVLMWAPLIPVLEKLLCLFIREKEKKDTPPKEIDRLEARFLDHPSLAIAQSRLALYSMAEKAEDNLKRAIGLLDCFDEKEVVLVNEIEEEVDRYEDTLGTYLVKITGKELDRRQNKDVSEFLHTISDFERIADYAVNISEVAKELHEKKLEFSPDAKKELDVIAAAVQEIVSLSVLAFEAEDLSMAYRVEPLEELIDNLCDEVKLNHIRRLQSGNCTLNQGFVFNDLITSYERIGDHCSNIAVAMIELDSDVFDTHEYLNSVKALRSQNFDRYFDEYKGKFAL